MKLGKEVQYLGHILSTTGIRPFISKTQAINNMHPPKTAKQVHAFLGLVGCHRKFIKNFAKMAKLLTLLTHSESKIWMDTSTSYSFFDTKGHSYTSTYLVLPRSSKTIHSIHSCIRWCMWSPTLTRIWLARISSSLSLSYLHGHRENGVLLNKNLMQYIMQLQSGTITSRELISSYAMATNHWQGF